MKLYQMRLEQLRQALSINDSEEIELQTIYQQLNALDQCDEPLSRAYIIASRTQNRLDDREEITKAVYRLMVEAQETLKCAIDSENDEVLWERALIQANKTDSMILTLLAAKFRELTFADQFLFLLIDFIFVGSLTGFAVGNALMMYWPIEPYTMSRLIIGYAAILPVFPIVDLALGLMAKRVVPMLVPTRLNVAKVYDALNQTGLSLYGKHPSERLSDSDSLIYNLINSVDHAKELAAVGCTNEPKEMCCDMLYTLMNDPVGCDQSPHRFERAVILAWLKREATHPFTKRPLYPCDLKRDFKLKREIDRHVSEQLIIRKINQHQNKSLVNLSIFQPDTLDLAENDDDDISDQLMANSAFGQGSKTYQKRY